MDIDLFVGLLFICFVICLVALLSRFVNRSGGAARNNFCDNGYGGIQAQRWNAGAPFKGPIDPTNPGMNIYGQPFTGC